MVAREDAKDAREAVKVDAQALATQVVMVDVTQLVLPTVRAAVILNDFS